MLLIPCPHCGPRGEDEFQFGGEHVMRPVDPNALTDAQWSDYLFSLENSAGMADERWWHAKGCRRWFLVTRDRAGQAISAQSLPGRSK